MFFPACKPFLFLLCDCGLISVCADLSKKTGVGPPDTLKAKYICGLVAKPFQVTKEYSLLIHDQTSSPRLLKVLKSWDACVRSTITKACVHSH